MVPSKWRIEEWQAGGYHEAPPSNSMNMDAAMCEDICRITFLRLVRIVEKCNFEF